MILEKHLIPGKLYKIGVGYSLSIQKPKSLEFFGLIQTNDMLMYLGPNVLVESWNLVSNHLFLYDTQIINLGVYTLDYEEVFLEVV